MRNYEPPKILERGSSSQVSPLQAALIFMQYRSMGSLSKYIRAVLRDPPILDSIVASRDGLEGLATSQASCRAVSV